jgi:hypothetical protein
MNNIYDATVDVREQSQSAPANGATSVGQSITTMNLGQLDLVTPVRGGSSSSDD